MKTKTKRTAKTEKTDAEDLVFRVWKLTPQSRSIIRDLRGTRQCETNAAVLDAAIASILPELTDALLRLGCATLAQKQQAYRLPMSLSSLTALQESSEKCGIAASHLFALVIAGLGDAPKARKTRKAVK